MELILDEELRMNFQLHYLAMVVLAMVVVVLMYVGFRLAEIL